MMRSLTRRCALGLGGGAACALVGALLAGCSDLDGDRSDAADPGASDSSAQEQDTSASTPSAFAGLVGADAQTAWEQLVGQQWYVRFEQSDAEGEPRTVAYVKLCEDEVVRQGGCPDAEGNPHQELGDGGWRGVLAVGVAGAAMIPAQITFFSGQEALGQLRKAGFTNVSVVEEGDVDPDASVPVACEPQPYAWAPLDGQVALTVTSDVAVPDVAGLSPIDATTMLRHQGLEADPAVTSYGYLPGESVPAAVSTSPAAGEIVRVGTVVHVEYDLPIEGTDPAQ